MLLHKQKRYLRRILNTVVQSECTEVLKRLPDNSIHYVISDPPYALAFMNVAWDAFPTHTGLRKPFAQRSREYDYGKLPFQKWVEGIAKECLRVLKPGGYLMLMGGTRTFHRLASGIEDAGFEIRDTFTWHHCLSEDTEILTEEGWKGIDEIHVGGKAFGLDIKTGKGVLSKVRKTYRYKKKKRPMIRIKNAHTSQLLTPNHWIISRYEIRKQVRGVREVSFEKKYGYRQAKEIRSYDRFFVPLGIRFDGDYSIGREFSELLGWILSDGSFHRECSAISIFQCSPANRKKVNRIRRLLIRLGVSFSEYKKNAKYKNKKYIQHQFYIRAGDITKRIRRLIPNKKPTSKLWLLPLVEKRALIRGLMLGDGCYGAQKYGTFYQKDVDTLEWFQVLCHLSGFRGGVNRKKGAVSIAKPETQIHPLNLKSRHVNYRGRVWCIETDIGNFVARRGDKIFVTSNSQGFNKGSNVGKAIDRRAGKKRKVIGKRPDMVRRRSKKLGQFNAVMHSNVGINTPEFHKHMGEITEPATELAAKWEGWNTNVKPATEFIVVARKPLSEKCVMDNVLKWGTGAINMEGCRIGGYTPDVNVLEKASPHGQAIRPKYKKVRKGLGEKLDTQGQGWGFKRMPLDEEKQATQGRLPSNLMLGHTEFCKRTGRKKVASSRDRVEKREDYTGTGSSWRQQGGRPEGFVNKGYADKSGKETIEQWACHESCPIRTIGANARFFYTAKAAGKEKWFLCKVCDVVQDGSRKKEHRKHEIHCLTCKKNGTWKKHRKHKTKPNLIGHPTQKPEKLMQWLIRMHTVKGGIVCDPFVGSGTVAIAAMREGMKFISIDMDATYVRIARTRLEAEKSSTPVNLTHG